LNPTDPPTNEAACSTVTQYPSRRADFRIVWVGLLYVPNGQAEWSRIPSSGCAPQHASAASGLPAGRNRLNCLQIELVHLVDDLCVGPSNRFETNRWHDFGNVVVGMLDLRRMNDLNRRRGRIDRAHLARRRGIHVSDDVYAEGVIRVEHDI